MKVLAVKSPWSEEIVAGRKTIEVRSRNTNIRERVAIYATRTKPKQQDIDWINYLGHPIDNLMRSYIIGTVEIYDSKPTQSVNYFIQNRNKHLCYSGMYKEGQYFWYLRNAQRITPIPYKMPKGCVVWSSIDDELIKEASLK